MTSEAPVVVPTNPGPIVRAGMRTADDEITPGPNMRSALAGWVKPMTLEVITITTVEGEAKEVRRTVSTTGVMQPWKSRSAKMGPDGVRAWRWKTLHTTTDIALKVEDRVIYKSIPYRVMGTWGFEDYGFFKYELEQDYQNVS